PRPPVRPPGVHGRPRGAGRGGALPDRDGGPRRRRPRPAPGALHRSLRARIPSEGVLSAISPPRTPITPLGLSPDNDRRGNRGEPPEHESRRPVQLGRGLRQLRLLRRPRSRGRGRPRVTIASHPVQARRGRLASPPLSTLYFSLMVLRINS